MSNREYVSYSTATLELLEDNFVSRQAWPEDTYVFMDNNIIYKVDNIATIPWYAEQEDYHAQDWYLINNEDLRLRGN